MSVTPEDVMAFTKPTRDFLCPLSANVYGLDFLSFTIEDYDTKRVIFEVNKENIELPAGFDFSMLDENSYRKIKYDFSVDVLRLPRISTILTFSVGPQPVENFKMIERHYFRDRLVKNFEFDFGFCIPNSRNTWNAVYDVPALDEDLVAEMLASPHETTSDSFYFVQDKLVMHNKASYRYTEFSIEAQGKANAENIDFSSAGTKQNEGAGSKRSEGDGGSAGMKYSDDDSSSDDEEGRKFSYK